MVDPGAAQAIVKLLSRWYRKRAKPHGIIDHFHRGTRMSYTTVSRIVPCLFSMILLSVAFGLYFVPSFMKDEPPLTLLALKTGWVFIVAVALLAPLQVLRESTVITDDGLLKCGVFGGETRMAWTNICTFQINPDDNKVIFRNRAKAKLTMSLAYDGWQDFLEMAACRMNPPLHQQFSFMLANLDAKSPVLRSTKKLRRAKWFSAS